MGVFGSGRDTPSVVRTGEPGCHFKIDTGTEPGADGQLPERGKLGGWMKEGEGIKQYNSMDTDEVC